MDVSDQGGQLLNIFRTDLLLLCGDLLCLVLLCLSVLIVFDFSSRLL